MSFLTLYIQIFIAISWIFIAISTRKRKGSLKNFSIIMLLFLLFIIGINFGSRLNDIAVISNGRMPVLIPNGYYMYDTDTHFGFHLADRKLIKNFLLTDILNFKPYSRLYSIGDFIIYFSFCIFFIDIIYTFIKLKKLIWKKDYRNN